MSQGHNEVKPRLSEEVRALLEDASNETMLVDDRDRVLDRIAKLEAVAEAAEAYRWTVRWSSQNPVLERKALDAALAAWKEGK